MGEIRGQKLLLEIQKQLLEDLKNYPIYKNDLIIDLSQSVGEGPMAYNYLDGQIEKFSSVYILDRLNNLIAEGWINFLLSKKDNLFIVYWDLICDDKKEIKDFGLPKHILDKIPDQIKNNPKRFKKVKKGRDIDIFEINENFNSELVENHDSELEKKENFLSKDKCNNINMKLSELRKEVDLFREGLREIEFQITGNTNFYDKLMKKKLEKLNNNTENNSSD